VIENIDTGTHVHTPTQSTQKSIHPSPTRTFSIIVVLSPSSSEVSWSSVSSSSLLSSSSLPLPSVPLESSAPPLRMLWTTAISIFQMLPEGLIMDVLRAERARGMCLHSSPLGPVPMDIFFPSMFLAPAHWTPMREAPSNCTPDKSVFLKEAPSKIVSRRFAPVKSTFVKSCSLRSQPSRSAFLSFAPWKRTVSRPFASLKSPYRQVHLLNTTLQLCRADNI